MEISGISRYSTEECVHSSSNTMDRTHSDSSFRKRSRYTERTPPIYGGPSGVRSLVSVQFPSDRRKTRPILRQTCARSRASRINRANFRVRRKKSHKGCRWMLPHPSATAGRHRGSIPKSAYHPVNSTSSLSRIRLLTSGFSGGAWSAPARAPSAWRGANERRRSSARPWGSRKRGSTSRGIARAKARIACANDASGT